MKNFIKSISYNQYIVCFLGILLYAWLILPVTLEHDAGSMYADAVDLVFRDYWPAGMVLIWHVLDRILPGGNLMLSFNVAFLWVACIMGMRIFKDKAISWWFLFIPFFPLIYRYAAEINKDPIFSFGYMFIVMFLTLRTLEDKCLRWWEGALYLFGVLVYTMGKVQANYFFFLMVFWVMYLLPPFGVRKARIFLAKALATALATGAIFWSMSALNTALIQESKNGHYWQYVKIYDLAGMSVFSNKMYVPQFLWKSPEITTKDLASHYDYLWEPLIRQPDAPLVSTKDDDQRAQLLQIWRETVVKDPLAYLKHRWRILFKILTGSAHDKFVEYAQTRPVLLKFAPFFYLFSFLPLFPIMLGFWGLSVAFMNKSRYALPLFMISGMGSMLVFVLFICSLAAAGRYIYFSWCCFMFSVPFVYQILREKKISYV